MDKIIIIGFILFIVFILVFLTDNPIRDFFIQFYSERPITSILCIILIIVISAIAYIDSITPIKSDYQRVQEYRHDNYYDCIDIDDYLPDGFSESDTYSENDLINAYNNGLEDGINQTIEYYESIEDD